MSGVQATGAHYDVVVIGAGVAGGAAARFLARGGKRVLVLEASAWPRHRETCSGVFGKTFALLDTKPGDYPYEIFEQPVPKMRLVFGGKAHGAFPEKWVRRFYDETLYFALRGEFEAWIMELAGRDGGRVELRAKQRVRPNDLSWDGQRYTLALGGGPVTCDHLVGAGGTHCPVRRRFFTEDRDRNDMVVLREAELESRAHGGFMTNYYYFDGCAGFAWLYPKGTDGRLANLGVCAVGDPRGGTSINDHWRAFVAHLKAEGLLDEGYDPDDSSGSSLYLAQLDGPVVANDETCFIVGDSAGVVHRDFWNGITPSIESGRLAAEHILGTGRYRRQDVSTFLFNFGKRGVKLKVRAVDFALRSALPRLHRFFEGRAAKRAGEPVAAAAREAREAREARDATAVTGTPSASAAAAKARHA